MNDSVWQDAAWRFRCGRDAPEPAQDFFDAAMEAAVRGRSGGVQGILEPFLPVPVLRGVGWAAASEYERPQSVGRVRAFYGNFGMFRARAGLHPGKRARWAAADHRRRGVERGTISAKSSKTFTNCLYSTPSMHEVVFSDRRQTRNGVKTGDIAKAADRLWLPSVHGFVSTGSCTAR